MRRRSKRPRRAARFQELCLSPTFLELLEDELFLYHVLVLTEESYAMRHASDRSSVVDHRADRKERKAT